METEIIINTASSRSTSNKENQDYISTPKVSNEQKAKRFGSKDDEGKYYEKNTISKECLETVKVDPKLLTAIQNLRDINDELVKSLQNLNGKFERQKELINIAAHELRSPTQAITGYVELLNLEPGNGKRYQNLIVKNAETLNILVLNILDTSRIDNQTLNLKKENFDIVKLINQIVDDLSSHIDSEKEVSIIFKYTRDNFHRGTEFKTLISEQNTKDKSLIIYADETRITQVIINLVENSIRYSKKGGKIIISLSQSIQTNNPGLIDNNKTQKDNEILIQVRDTGKGISPEILPHIFSKFVSDPNSSGTGLGLHVSKNIIEAHGGKLSVENNNSNQYKTGATFSIRLPITID